MEKLNKTELIETTKIQALDAKESIKRARSRSRKRTAEMVFRYFSSVYFELTGKEVTDGN